nr:MAG TPA: hypothetical protein [Caudoviricetes sp.]
MIYSPIWLSLYISLIFHLRIISKSLKYVHICSPPLNL